MSGISDPASGTTVFCPRCGGRHRCDWMAAMAEAKKAAIRAAGVGKDIYLPINQRCAAMIEALNYLKEAAYVFYILAIVGSVVIVILENRNPLKTMAWILVLTCLPVVGLVAYLVFGQKWYKRHLIGKRSYKRTVQSPALRELRKTRASFPKEYAALADLLGKTGGGVPFPGNSVVPYFDGASFMIALLREIASAHSHVHLDYYIFMDDAIGSLVADALIDKARQGVRVRLIVDDLGSWKAKEKFFKRLQAGGVEVVKFMPVHLSIQSRINYRNHRKITVIDGDRGFIGGMNVADRYVLGVPWGDWRDTQVMVKGYAAHQLQMVFIRDWYFATRTSLMSPAYFPTCSLDGSASVQVATSAPFDQWRSIMQGLALALARAKDYFFCETPYFMPTEPVLCAMQSAALAGVDVRIIIPHRSDSLLTQLATRSYVKDLLSAGVKVYMYEGGFIHSKMMVSDDLLSVVGSSNMDFRSFEQNFEANVFIYDKEAAAAIKKQFQIDQSHSRRLTLQVWKHRPKHIKVKESLVRVFSPLL